MKIKPFIKDLFLFALLYIFCIVLSVVIYAYFNFGIVSIDKFLSVLREVFNIDWAVKKIKLYLTALLFVAGLGVCFFKTKHIVILSILTVLLPIIEFDIVTYLQYKNIKTDFYEKNYVTPQIEKTQKNNLIVVYLESFEKQYAKENVAPFLQNLAKQNSSFDGFYQTSETLSTIHAQFASLCGLPLFQENLSGDSYINFLPKVKCIPDLLKENGYTTAYFKAADLSFSRANYFTNQHSFDVVKGLNEFKNDAAKITPNYMGNKFGGLKDRVFLELVKTEISKLKEPFFATLTTLDAHSFPNIYYDPECKKTFNDPRDVAYCTDQMIENFISWLKEQSYWNKTTVVLMGDHQVPSRFISTSEIFNVFVNSKQSTNNTKRQFTTYDLAPSFLEAIGYDIAELGIGRSLFKDGKTLIEQEQNKFNKLISAKNDLYNQLKEFQNIETTYKDYNIEQTLDNETLFNYSDFGEKNKWCNKNTYISMTLNKLPKDNLYLKIKYFKVNEPFEIFVNDTKIYKNEVQKHQSMQEENQNFNIPISALNNGNKISIKIDHPLNNINNVFGLCIKEFVLTENE